LNSTSIWHVLVLKEAEVAQGDKLPSLWQLRGPARIAILLVRVDLR